MVSVTGVLKNQTGSSLHKTLAASGFFEDRVVDRFSIGVQSTPHLLISSNRFHYLAFQDFGVAGVFFSFFLKSMLIGGDWWQHFKELVVIFKGGGKGCGVVNVDVGLRTKSKEK